MHQNQNHLEGLWKPRLLGPQPQNFWFRRSEVSPGICTFNKFSDDPDAAGPGTTDLDDVPSLGIRSMKETVYVCWWPHKCGRPRQGGTHREFSAAPAAVVEVFLPAAVGETAAWIPLVQEVADPGLGKSLSGSTVLCCSIRSVSYTHLLKMPSV